MADESPPPTARTSVWQKIVAVLMLFLPKQVSEAYRLGLLPVLAVLAATIFILPLMVVGLAAMSLRALSWLDWDWTNAAQRSYLSLIYRGFSIEELAKSQVDKQNVRLDYFQILAFTVKPSQPHKDRYRLRPGQHALLEINTAKLVVPYDPGSKSKCTLPQTNDDLIVVKIDGVELKRQKEVDDDSDPRLAYIDDDFWKKNASAFSFDSDKVNDIVLSFEPTEFVNKLQCGSVDFRGSLTVYKDFFVAKK